MKTNIKVVALTFDDGTTKNTNQVLSLLDKYDAKANKNASITLLFNEASYEYYVSYVTKYVKPGSIILLHPMYDNTGQEFRLLEGIMKNLSTEGYQFITVNELKKLKQ